MMIMGAVLAFAATQMSGSPYLGIVAGIAGGAAFSLLFGFLTLTLVANQVATGLALTILGLGLSGQIGESFVGQPGIKLQPIVSPILRSEEHTSELQSLMRHSYAVFCFQKKTTNTQ